MAYTTNTPFFNWFQPMFHNYSAANSAVRHWAKPTIKPHHRLSDLQNRLDTSSSMVSVNSALCITIGISILFDQRESGLDHSSTMPGKLTSLSEQMSNCFADVLFYLHNVELLLNDEFKPDVDNLFCRSANRSARTTRMGSEFCSCVETVLTIGRFQLKKGVVNTTVKIYRRVKTLTFHINPRRHRPFRILPRHKGGGGVVRTTPLPFRPWLG